MKRNTIIIAAVSAAVVAMVIGISVAGQAAHGPATGVSPVAGASGAPTLLPVTANPITNTSTAPGLTIVGALAENNVDAVTKQPTADRLQVTLKNTSSASLSGFEIYYTMTDATTKQKESYYLPLAGLTLAAGATTDVFFDNQAATNHFAENTYSIYRSSKNQVDFAIEVSAKGVAIAKGTAVKSAGTGEVVGG